MGSSVQRRLAQLPLTDVQCLHACKQPLPAYASKLPMSFASSLGTVMRYLMANTGRDFIQEVERLGLSLSQIKTLQLMADAKPSTVGALADAVGLSVPAVSRAVDGLYKARPGQAGRRSSADRRAKRVSLTAKGRRTFEGLLALRAGRPALRRPAQRGRPRRSGAGDRAAAATP